MSVCANRPAEECGFFTACTTALGHKPCACGAEVETEGDA